MQSVEDWLRKFERRAEGIELEDFIRQSLFIALFWPKGRRLKRELPDLLNEAIVEGIESLTPEQRADFDEHRLTPEFCLDVHTRFVRIQAREYQRLRRRPISHSLFEGESGQSILTIGMMRQNPRLVRLLEALERLPEELQEILLLNLEAKRFDPRSAEVNYVTRILGIGRTTYYLRLQQALAELKRQLEQNDGM